MCVPCVLIMCVPCVQFNNYTSSTNNAHNLPSNGTGFCPHRDTISKRYCKLCAMYFVTQAALKRHKKEKICKTTNVECWLHDEDVQLEQSEELELEGRLEVSVEEVPVVDVEAVQTATRRNLFDLFETCLKNALNKNDTVYLVSYS